RSALLGANYLAAKLNEVFPVLNWGENGLGGHETILDRREATAQSGITASTRSTRLIDFGLHAPTLALTYPGTLIVGPTKPDDKAELDRFIEVRRTIRAEIDALGDEYSYEESPLAGARHPATVVMDGWDGKYSRETAVFPAPGLRLTKYFPPVSRIDGAYGDRNLVCSCPPPEAFEEFEEEDK